jgi:hypothetical protein
MPPRARSRGSPNVSNPCPVDDDPPDKHSFRKPVPRLGGGLVVAQMLLEQKTGRKFPGISEVWDRPVRSVTSHQPGADKAFPSLFHNRLTVAPAVTFASMESCWCFNGLASPPSTAGVFLQRKKAPYTEEPWRDCCASESACVRSLGIDRRGDAITTSSITTATR